MSKVIPILRPILLCAVVLTAGACQQTANPVSAPSRHDAPMDGQAGFQLAADPRILEGRGAVVEPVAAGRYTLAQLIDIAQTNSPSTRTAWLRAKQAAEAVGLVDTAYMPRVSAQILAGAATSERDGLQDPLGRAPDGVVHSNGRSASATLSVEWLLFDFGKRDAARAEAEELSFAANVGFNGAHQKLIYDVTQAYYDLHAAQRREAVQRRRVSNAREIANVTDAKREQGLRTVTDVAQAQQTVAQARFDLARAQSRTQLARTQLTARLGLPAGRQVSPVFPSKVTLPKSVPASLEAHIDRALARRPDLHAAFARARASAQHVSAVEAEFRPRIVASARLGQRLGSTRVDDDRIGGALTVNSNRPVAGVFVGMTIPLWDAGARERRLRIAQDGHRIAQADAQSLRLLAESEIVGAYELLKSSLAANQAAAELLSTSRVSHNAAVNFERRGLAGHAEVSVAQQLLFDAELAQIEAQHAALSAAATLAFASGQLG